MATDSDWMGRIVFVLAMAVAISFIIAVVTIALSPVPFSGGSERALSAGFGALLGIVSTYLYLTRKKAR